jgi:hypothetical protein
LSTFDIDKSCFSSIYISMPLSSQQPRTSEQQKKAKRKTTYRVSNNKLPLTSTTLCAQVQGCVIL